jgi:anti-sigma B factor antagonist
LSGLIEIEVATVLGGALISVSGEIDVSNCAELEERLGDQLAKESPTVLDMREVEFIGSAGVRVLLQWAGQARKLGFAVAIVASSKAVLRPLAVTGADAEIAVFPNTTEALDFVRS